MWLAGGRANGGVGGEPAKTEDTKLDGYKERRKTAFQTASPVFLLQWNRAAVQADFDCRAHHDIRIR